MTEDPTGAEQPDEPTPAKDGDLTEDELQARREKRQGQPISDTAAEEAANGGGEEDGAEGEQQEFILVERGKEVTLSQLYTRGTPVQREWKFEGKSSKGSGGLVPFTSPDVPLFVEGRAGKVEIDPTYASDGSIEKVTVRSIIKAVYVLDARTEAAQVRMREIGAAEEARRSAAG